MQAQASGTNGERRQRNSNCSGKLWFPLVTLVHGAAYSKRACRGRRNEATRPPEASGGAFVILASPQMSSYITGEILPIIEAMVAAETFRISMLSSR